MSSSFLSQLSKLVSQNTPPTNQASLAALQAAQQYNQQQQNIANALGMAAQVPPNSMPLSGLYLPVSSSLHTLKTPSGLAWGAASMPSFTSTVSHDAPMSNRVVCWAQGSYSVGIDEGRYYVTRTSRQKTENGEDGQAYARFDLYSGEQPPTRALVAAIIRWDRDHRPKVNARDVFGSLLGVRYFRLTDHLMLQSPAQGTVWEAEVLHADHWSDESVVRGVYGIHAAWPSMGSDVKPVIDFEDSHVVAHVRGQGRFAAGKMGWRAEIVIVDTVYLPRAVWPHRRRLEKRYPAITFEEESWTLEKSSRSVK